MATLDLCGEGRIDTSEDCCGEEGVCLGRIFFFYLPDIFSAVYSSTECERRSLAVAQKCVSIVEWTKCVCVTVFDHYWSHGQLGKN